MIEAQIPVDPPSQLAIDSRPSRLLRWMNARSYGSSLQFKTAVEYLYAGTNVGFFATALRLSALGHAEFDWGGPDLRWNAVPASCYSVWRGNARYLGVCGLLPENIRQELQTARIGIEEDFDYFLESESMPRVLVRDNPHSRRLLVEYGISVAPTIYTDLRLRLPSVASLLTAGEIIDVPEVASRFNPIVGRFEEEAQLKAPFVSGCYRIFGYPRATYCWLTPTESENPVCRTVDRSIGMWGSYIGGPLLKFSLCGGKLTIPAFPSLPVLYERMLYFSGARCLNRTNAVLTFDNVGGEAVGALTQKLPLQRKK